MSSPSDQNADPSPSVSNKTAPVKGVFNIPASADAMKSVAERLMTEFGHDPLALADVSIYVPAPEIRQLLRQSLIDAAGGEALMLPNIMVVGEAAAPDLALKTAGNPLLSQTLLDVPPPVSHLKRQMILAAEIMKIPGMASSVEKAIALGGELGRFLDDTQRYNVDITRLKDLVPPEYAGQWGPTERFLKIIAETWPQKLKDMGRTDPEAHRILLLEAQAAQMKQFPPQQSVLAVGFQNVTPSQAAFLSAVLAAPKGRVVLSGLDAGLDAQSWDALSPVHPQAGLRQILWALNVERSGVQNWQDTPETFTEKARAKLLREALRPAETAEGWSQLKSRKTVRRGLDADKKDMIDAVAVRDVDLLTVGSSQEEASVVALKLRQVLEKPGQTAAVITADRSLARRIVARLKHWKIDVEDGAGMALSDTLAGRFFLSTAQMAARKLAPVPLLETLKHPLASLGRTHDDLARDVSALEDMVLHGPRPAPGAVGLQEGLGVVFNRASRRPEGMPSDLAARHALGKALVDDLAKAGGACFDRMASTTPAPFVDFLDEHIRFAEAVAAAVPASDGAAPASALWQGKDGAALARFLKNVRAEAVDLPPMTGVEYADVLRGLMRGVDVRADLDRHPRLKILTPQQAAWQKFDVAIIAGMNDEVWPPRPAQNPWLSPEMIAAAGLPAQDSAIGNSALNFAEAMSSPRVILSRAMRSGSAPAAASPFLTRLVMVLRGAGIEKDLASKESLVEINAALHAPDAVVPIAPPEPRPDPALRPKELPVSAIENLMRDPYSVYARYILKLRPKAPIDATPSASEKGIFTHAALDAFVRKYPDKLPPNAEEELLKMGAETFKTRMSSPVVQAFWWPRFERIAKWFVKFENNRRELCHTLGTEVRGRLTFDLGDGETFTLTAIADRIDANEDGQVSIIDYKTGAIPTQKDVESGLSPQLTLEALIAVSGGFKDIRKDADIETLQYWKLSGGRPASEITDVKADPESLIAAAKEGVAQLMRAFNDKTTPYLPAPRAEAAPHYTPYAHLARTGEWSMVTRTEKPKPAPKPDAEKPQGPPKKSAKKSARKSSGRKQP